MVEEKPPRLRDRGERCHLPNAPFEDARCRRPRVLQRVGRDADDGDSRTTDMTTPDERKRAQERTWRLLRDLANEETVPGVPRAYRREAAMVLRHLATPGEVHDMLETSLRLFHAEHEREVYRASAARVTGRWLVRWAVVLPIVLLLGLWLGRMTPQ